MANRGAEIKAADAESDCGEQIAARTVSRRTCCRSGPETPALRCFAQCTRAIWRRPGVVMSTRCEVSTAVPAAVGTVIW